MLLGFSESGKFVLAPDNKSKGGLYPEKGTGCFSLFGPRVLPEPTKADKREVSAVSFFVYRGSGSGGPSRSRLRFVQEWEFKKKTKGQAYEERMNFKMQSYEKTYSFDLRLGVSRFRDRESARAILVV